MHFISSGILQATTTDCDICLNEVEGIFVCEWCEVFTDQSVKIDSDSQSDLNIGDGQTEKLTACIESDCVSLLNLIKI